MMLITRENVWCVNGGPCIGEVRQGKLLNEDPEVGE